MNPKIKARIDSMGQEELCRTWTLAYPGDPLIQGEAGEYFKRRMKELGGFTSDWCHQILFS